MIASLCGTLRDKGVAGVVVEVGGVGYLVHVSLQTLAELPAEGAKVTLLCHTHVREDALQLYGFLQPRERVAFELLKSVSGVGPKLALMILSGMPVDDLTTALAGGSVHRLTNIPGVGKKTAERLILELRERFAAVAAGSSATGSAEPAEGIEQLVDALVSLGYKRPLAERAVKQVARTAAAATTPPEQLLRRALAVIQDL